MQQRFLLQILLLAQHVSGTTMPIIRSSRVLYNGCCLWYLVLWFFKLLVWCGAEGYASCLQDAAASSIPVLHTYGPSQNMYLTTRSNHSRQTSMPPTVSEPKIPANERPQAHALNHAATEISSLIPAKLISMEFNMQAIYVRRSELFFWNCTKLA